MKDLINDNNKRRLIGKFLLFCLLIVGMISVSVAEEDYPEINEGEIMYADIGKSSGGLAVFSFTPKETGTYVIKVYAAKIDICHVSLESNGPRVYESYYGSNEDNKDYQEGITYYLGFRSYGTERQFPFIVYKSRVLEATIEGDTLCISGEGAITTSFIETLYDGNKILFVQGIRNLVIGEGIIEIDHSSFDGFSNLETVSLPSTLMSIESSAFSHCVSLSKIEIPDSVTYIGYYAFSGCAALKEIVLSRSIDRILNNVFSDCISLVKIIIPEGVKTIYAAAFCNCEGLKEVILPKSLVSLEGDFIFSGCRNLENISLPDNMERISGNNLFQNCDKLKVLYLPDNIQYFYSAIPYYITVYANLESTTAKNMRNNDFRIPGSNCDIRYAGNGVDSSIELVANGGDINATEIVIPEGVTKINYSAFKSFSNLKHIIIPDSVVKIDIDAFANCTNLEYISIPESVQYIYNGAFSNCTSLESITIPGGVSCISDNAFSSCTSLKKICFLHESDPERFYFGDNIFDENPDLKVYCYMFYAPYNWCLSHDIEPVCLDMIDINTIKEIDLPEYIRLKNGEVSPIPMSLFAVKDEEIEWQSSDPEIVMVENGRITAKGTGNATITARVDDLTAVSNIEIYQPATALSFPSEEYWLQATENVRFDVVAIPENASFTLKWISSDTTFATVDEDGLITTIKPGDVIIQAITEENVTAEITLHLCYPVKGIELDAENVSLKKYQSGHLYANVQTSGGSFVNKLIQFSSSDDNIVSVTQDGVLYAKNTGNVRITTKSYSGKTAVCNVEVLEPNILKLPDSLQIIETEAFINLNGIDAIYIPKEVSLIEENAFDLNVILLVPEEESPWIEWAIEHGYSAVGGVQIEETE